MGPLREQIYMIDIRIHDIHLDSVKELECLDDQQDFKIYAHFLNFDPVMVHDNLNMECKALPILFKMNPEALIEAIDRSPLTLSVAGMLEGKREYTVGTVKVLFTESFAEAISMATSSVMFPVIAEIDDIFKFRNLYHEESGDLSVHLKLNCFGDIDIRRLDPCDKDKEESVYPKDETDECKENKEIQLSPIFTDIHNVTPATTMANKYEGIKLPIPWTIDVDQPVEKFDPCSDYLSERISETAAKPCEVTLQCTCNDGVPDNTNNILLPTINLKCQCAEILAAMKSCFPDCPPNNAQQTLPNETFEPPASNNPQQVIPPAVHLNSSHEQTRPLPSEPQQESTPTNPNYSFRPSLNKPLSSDNVQQPQIDNTPQQVTKLSEIPYNNQPPLKTPSEEKPLMPPMPINKAEFKNVVPSNHEIAFPEKYKLEESTKKLHEQKAPTWDERKHNIKKEYKKKKKLSNGIYEYTAGMYPGMVVGHKYCLPTIRIVPKNMGWLWNLAGLFSNNRSVVSTSDCHCRLNPRCTLSEPKKSSTGWRPGAMLKTVAQNFSSWNKAAGFKEGDDVETFFNFKKEKEKKKVVAKAVAAGKTKTKEKEKSDEYEPEDIAEDAHGYKFKPTLHVHKKDKFYHVTMNPPGVDPRTKPISFKIDPRKGSSDEETSSASTSDDSFEFEYTVPAGLIPPPRKIERATQDTQYNPEDYTPKIIPKKGECLEEEKVGVKKEVKTEKKNKPKKGAKPGSKGKKGKKK